MATTKFYKDLTRDQVIERLTAQDVRTIITNIDEGDYNFLADIIQGNGFTQYNNMTPGDLEAEYGEREDRILELIDDDLMPWDV
jgi:hypothetical protein